MNSSCKPVDNFASVCCSPLCAVGHPPAVEVPQVRTARVQPALLGESQPRGRVRPGRQGQGRGARVQHRRPCRHPAQALRVEDHPAQGL